MVDILRALIIAELHRFYRWVLRRPDPPSHYARFQRARMEPSDSEPDASIR